MPVLLQINSTIGRGSTGRIADQIAGHALQESWTCYMAHGPRFVGASDSIAYQVTGKAGELVHFAFSRIFDRHGLGSICATKRLIRKIEEIQPDIVQIHNIHGYYMNYELLFKFLANEGIPTVITMHDFWLMTGHCAYINQRCGKWETGCGHCPRLGEYPAAIFDHSRTNWALKKQLLDGFDRNQLVIVPVSYWLEKYAKRSLLSNCQFHVIQNGVDTTLFRPFEGEHSEMWKRINWSKFTIISVADRWTDANGFYDIIELSRILPDNMQLVMVGLSDQQMEELPGTIVGIGHTNDVRQLVELYSSADVLFNASKEVTFGLVTAEAMACGTPAIVFKNTAGEEVIDKETGYAIDRIEEIPELVYSCRDRASTYLDKCRKRIEDHFDSYKQYSKYIALYNGFLDKE